MTRTVSIVIPVYNEGEAVVPYLDQIIERLDTTFEVLVVHDMPEDTTVPVLSRYDNDIVVPTLNTYGRGPANAIRFGLDSAKGDVIVVTMADGSDDARQIPEMVRLVREGNAVVAASRYMKGGRQVGGPAMKAWLSRIAGVSLYHLGRVGTHDATNSFKAYRADFIRRVGVESAAGFEIGIELVAKARRGREPVTEIPTTWHDRTDGESRFNVIGWMPKYLRWYFYAFGPRIDRPAAATRSTQ
jgi:glycosyltransferase involved in cell wall biosynthesis